MFYVISCCTRKAWSQDTATFTFFNSHRMSVRTCLDVGLWQCYHLGKNVSHLQILHLIPLPSSLVKHKERISLMVSVTSFELIITQLWLGHILMHLLRLFVVMPPEVRKLWEMTYMMQNMYSVCSLSGFPIMHYVGDEVISCVLLCSLCFFCQVLTKVYVPVELTPWTSAYLYWGQNTHSLDITSHENYII